MHSGLPSQSQAWHDSDGLPCHTNRVVSTSLRVVRHRSCRRLRRGPHSPAPARLRHLLQRRSRPHASSGYTRRSAHRGSTVVRSESCRAAAGQRTRKIRFLPSPMRLTRSGLVDHRPERTCADEFEARTRPSPYCTIFESVSSGRAAGACRAFPLATGAAPLRSRRSAGTCSWRDVRGRTR